MKNILYFIIMNKSYLSWSYESDEKVDYHIIITWSKDIKFNKFDLKKEYLFSNKSFINFLYQIYCDSNNFNKIKNKFNLSEYNVTYYKISDFNIDSLLKFDLNYIYLTNIKYKIREIECILFNENSIKFLSEQLIDNFIDKKMYFSKKNLMEFRIWLYDNVDNPDSLIILSSNILYIYGIRSARDIDIYSKIYHKDLAEKKFEFVDAKIENFNIDKWTNWKKWIGHDINDVIDNPKYYFYFLGMKFMTLDLDIKKRLYRAKPKCYVDIYMINKLLKYNIKFDYMFASKNVYVSCKDKTNEEIIEFEKELNGKYIKEYNEIKCIKKIDKNIYIECIQKYLLKFYGLDYDQNKILNEFFNCDSIDKIKTKIKLKK